MCFVWQLSMIILFGVFVRYNEESDSHWADYRKEKNITSDIENDYYYRYPSRCTNQFSYFNSCLLNVVFILMFIINTDCMIIICIIENIGFLKNIYNYYRTVASYRPIYISKSKTFNV